MYAKELLFFLTQTSWKVERTIIDEKQKTQFSFTGNAYFQPYSKDSQKVWLYSEAGELVDERQRLTSVHRRYIYQLKDDSTIEVLFENTQFFFSLNCQDLTKLNFEHHCSPDFYQGEMILDKSSWQLRWNVSGPQKELSIQSLFR